MFARVGAMREATQLALGELPSGDFRWRSRFWHLTYAGHIPPQVLMARLSRMMGIKVPASVVHETGDTECPHTHTSTLT